MVTNFHFAPPSARKVPGRQPRAGAKYRAKASLEDTDPISPIGREKGYAIKKNGDSRGAFGGVF